MQIRPKTYLQLTYWWRSFRDLMPRRARDAPVGTSPPLIYAAIVLALLLAILETDVHRGELASLGLLSNEHPIDSSFLSP